MSEIRQEGARKRPRKAPEPYRVRMLAALPKGGCIAEIGVWKGDYSAQLLRVLKPRELHLIDPWAFDPYYAPRWYGGAEARSQDDMDAIHKGVERRFAEAPQVRINRRPSVEALNGFPDGSFDLIYVDGNHSFEHVLQDLVVAYRKLRRGGFLCADDWDWKDEQGRTSVREAVVAFLQVQVVDFVQIRGGQVVIEKA